MYAIKKLLKEAGVTRVVEVETFEDNCEAITRCVELNTEDPENSYVVEELDSCFALFEVIDGSCGHYGLIGLYRDEKEAIEAAGNKTFFIETRVIH